MKQNMSNEEIARKPWVRYMDEHLFKSKMPKVLDFIEKGIPQRNI